MPNCKRLDMKLLKMIVNYCERLIEVDFISEISNGLSEESIDFLFENLSFDIEQLFFRGQSFYNEFNITRLINRCTKLRKLDIYTNPWTNRVFRNLPHLNPHKNRKPRNAWPYIPIEMLRHWIWDMKSDQVNLFKNQGCIHRDDWCDRCRTKFVSSDSDSDSDF